MKKNKLCMILISFFTIKYLSGSNLKAEVLDEWQKDNVSFQIIKLPVERWPEYKALRLKARQEAPLAVIENAQEMAAVSDEEWARRLQQSQKNCIYLFAQTDKKIIGIIGGVINNYSRISHWARVISVYVVPEYRNKGVALHLMKTLSEVLLQKNVSILQLDVVIDNIGALNLYKKLGFKVVGERKKNYRLDGKYFDDYVMSKELKKIE